MKVAMETFVADLANRIDWVICKERPKVKKVPRNFRLYLLLEKLRELHIIYSDCTGNMTRIRPTKEWSEIMIEERQFPDEIEEITQPVDKAVAVAEPYRAEVIETLDEFVFERAHLTAQTYRGLKLGVLEHIGGSGFEKRIRMVESAHEIVERVGLAGAIDLFEANPRPNHSN